MRDAGASAAAATLEASNAAGAEEGIWIGLDFGTSNSGCAVWDSANGRAKWIRLPKVLAPLTKSNGGGKLGRSMPSAVMVCRQEQEEHSNVDHSSQSTNSNSNTTFLVGQSAMDMVDNAITTLNNHDASAEAASNALVTSVKRIFGMKPSQLRQDCELMESLPLSLVFTTGSGKCESSGHSGCGDDAEQVFIKVVPLHDNDCSSGSSPTAQEPQGAEAVLMTPMQVTSIILRSLREAAQQYLQTQGRKKHLQVPGMKSSLSLSLPDVRNCVVGVPAHYGQAQRHEMEEACRLAGFDGHISTVTESTAASMAYGLFVSSSSSSSVTATATTEQTAQTTKPCKTILVFDMGGGTTDLTIAEMKTTPTVNHHEEQNNDAYQNGNAAINNVPSSFRVVVASGDSHLGGDDMDQALLHFVWLKFQQEHGDAASEPIDKKPRRQDISLPMQERRRLLRECRRAKEELCGNENGAATCTILVCNSSIEVTLQEFNDAIEPLIRRTRELVASALRKYQLHNDDDDDDTANNTNSIDEVVLVGGATRVPKVRDMLRQTFPHVELCTSINADSAVAQGAAIQAALQSGLVPLHELRSALMLDALPHSIGVLLDDGSFLAILERDALLPAIGYASFSLADVNQAGVTVVAVEHVGNGNNKNYGPLYEPLGEFSFLLRRLSDDQLSKLDGKRSVDIGMTMETDGKFVVSIFDPNDPEHVNKKRRLQRNKMAATSSLAVPALDYHAKAAGEDEEEDGEFPVAWTREEVRMMFLPFLLFALYIGVKIAFHEPQVSP